MVLAVCEPRAGFARASSVECDQPLLRHFPHCICGTFMAKTAVLDSSERHDVGTSARGFIEVDGAEAQPPSDIDSARKIAREQATRQAVRRGVCGSDRLFQTLERQYAEERTKYLAIHHFHTASHVLQYGRAEHRPRPLPTGHLLRALFARFANPAFGSL